MIIFNRIINEIYIKIINYYTLIFFIRKKNIIIFKKMQIS